MKTLLIITLILLFSDAAVGGPATHVVMAKKVVLRNQPELPQSQRYMVREAKGEVLIKQPFSSRWLPARVGMVLPKETLLMVSAHSRVTLALTDGKHGGRGDGVMVSINTPIVARLDQQLWRQTKVTSQFLEDQTTDVESQTLAQTDESTLQQLRGAWVKVLALSRKEAPAEQLAKKREFEERRASRSISIVYPLADDRLAGSPPFTEIRVIWKPVPQKGVLYTVKFWHADEDPPAVPTGSTEGHQFVISPPAYGRYHLIVSTSDGVWQSKPLRFSIVSPEGVSGLGTPDKAKTDFVPLALRNPPDRMTVVGARLPYPIAFVWDVPPGMNDAVYEVTVRDPDNKIVARSQVRDTQVDLGLTKAGSYNWQVIANQTDAREGVVRTATSDRRFFRVEDGTPKKGSPPARVALGPQLKAMFATPGRKVLVLEGGL